MTNFLDSISSPDDIKHLSLSELESLAKECKARIIDVMAINGGHLASNLGSIELTIAMHKVFNSPKDRFVFDVGHQCYTHKLLTGRNNRFETVRQSEGLSGFCHPKESEHDPFYTGHAGAAFSQSLGLAKSRDLKGNDHHILPLIGDATLTCGLLYEAFNNIPKDLKNFIVILNDNEMSIAKNVGAITQILGKMINSPASNKFCHEFGEALSKIPSFGDYLADSGGKLKRSLKNLVSGATFFEQFHMAYVGPIDGHNLGKVIETLEAVKNSPRPVILHLKTVKGHGMEMAAANPVSYHGVKPFDKVTCLMHKAKEVKPTFPKIFGKEIAKLAKKDPSFVVVTPAMPAGSCLSELMINMPNRCIDVGIAEGHSLTYAAGIARDGNHNVMVSIYSTFLQRGLDNLYHDICIQEIPVVLAIDRGGLAGGDGITHNGIYDIGFLNEMPNMVIAQPRNGQLLKELLNVCFDWKRPTAIRYPNLPTNAPSDNVMKTIELGKAELLHDGDEICIITLGHMSKVGDELRLLLKEKGYNPTLIDPIFVKPLDKELLLQTFATHKLVITIEEHSIKGGLGSIINDFILQNGLHHLEVANFGVADEFIQHGSHSYLSEKLGLTAPQICETLEIKSKLSVCV
ncbi:MAG: 1-deoxy-D-xylulose-5-phosphate synthase [Rhabdochlamydiaceae bacterium]|nr:1-deoxy-D-xylulose-5-phosphate synthase [Candidatus Amphrikana amoebophyrae]